MVDNSNRILCITSAQKSLSTVLETWGTCRYLASDASVAEIGSAIDEFRPLLVVVFGCKNIIPMRLLEKVDFFNIHLSLLPAGRGPVPHIWSLIEGNGVGVTIHKMSAVVDEGPIAAQSAVVIDIGSHTLESAFELLLSNALSLLSGLREELLLGDPVLVRQSGVASAHTLREHSEIQARVDEGLTSPLGVLLADLRSLLAPETERAIDRTPSSGA